MKGNARLVRALAAERRRSHRFPIECGVYYKTLDHPTKVIAASGLTINISGSGILFGSAHNIPVGTRLELAISWPARLNEKHSLDLVTWGRVTRTEDGFVALKIQRYQFQVRTDGG